MLKARVAELEYAVGLLQELQRSTGIHNFPSPACGRSLAVAITNAETALLWAGKACDEAGTVAGDDAVEAMRAAQERRS